jgi:Holliday junction resolvase-like predicted endonuclease
MLHFDTLANKLLSTLRQNYFSGYVHIDVIVKSSKWSSTHAYVKFKFRWRRIVGVI